MDKSDIRLQQQISQVRPHRDCEGNYKRASSTQRICLSMGCTCMEVRISLSRYPILKTNLVFTVSEISEIPHLTDTGENAKKWTRVFSTQRWVILVARTRRKKDKKIACPLLDVFACGQVSSPRLYRLKNIYLSKILQNKISFSDKLNFFLEKLGHLK